MTFATFSYTRVLVTFTDGKRVVQEMLVSKDIGSLLSEDNNEEKWRLFTEELIDTMRRDALEDAAMVLETLDDVTEINRMLAGEVKGALD